MDHRLHQMFRALLFPALLLSAPAWCNTAAAQEPTGILLVEVTGLSESQGDVYIAVYDSRGTWLGDEAVLTREASIAEALKGDVVAVELELPIGDYAFSVFYDHNGNGKLDTNFIGLPREPIAISNNAKGKFGPPKFTDALFRLGLEPQVQRVNIGRL